MSLAVAVALLNGCSSSFFKIDPETAPTASPAAAPATPKAVPPTVPQTAPPTVPAPTPKPPTKPTPEKPVQDKPTPTKAAAGKPAVVELTKTPSNALVTDAIAEPEPPPVASDSAGIQRLVRLATVWQTVTLHHPYLASRSVAWDSALIRVIPEVRRATTTDIFATAIRRLLSVLGDPLSRIERDSMPDRVEIITPVRADLTNDGVLVLQLRRDASFDSADSALVTQALARAPQRVIVDMRSTSAGRADVVAQAISTFVERTGLARELTTVPVLAPTERVRRIGGPAVASPFRPFGEGSDAWVQHDARVVAPAAATARRVAMIANAGTLVPASLLALVDAGRATLIAEGSAATSLDEEGLVTTATYGIANRVVARVRVGELMHADGSTGLTADTIVAPAVTAADSAPAMRAALQIVRAGRAPRGKRAAAITMPAAVLPVAMDNTNYPSMGARLLAGFRLWGAMRARHANRDLYDEELETVFTRVIPRLESARNEQEYAAAIADLASSLDDAEAVLSGPSLQTWLGTSTAPVRLRFVEGRALITDVVHDSATTALGLIVGTEITAADGFPLAAWMSEHKRIGAASNEWTRNREQMRVMPLGPEGSALFKVRDATGKERTVNIPRRASYAAQLPQLQRPDATPIRKLDGNTGYIDIERVNDVMLDSALTSMSGTRALILDLRSANVGPLRSSLLLGRLATQPRFVQAREIRRYSVTPCPKYSLRDAVLRCPDERVEQLDWRDADTTGHYRGRVVLLIDERTQGAAERLAIALEAATTVTYVGSQSAGAASLPVPLELPGALSVGIPVVEVRRADGGQLQRVGITPSVDARPTVRGIRNRDDEVLQRAQQWIAQQLDAPVRRKR